jgi:hypothetical protein
MRLCHPTRRTRLRLVLLAVLSLLLQQVALAAYACSPGDVPATNTAMAAHCDDMPMSPGEPKPTLCPAHCAQPTLATPDVHAPTVPPLLLPALLPAPIVLAPLPIAHATYTQAATWRRSGTPPTLRFRVLLI